VPSPPFLFGIVPVYSFIYRFELRTNFVDEKFKKQKEEAKRKPEEILIIVNVENVFLKI